MSAAHSVSSGTLVAYLSVSTLVPAAVAVGYDESPWPFLAAGAIMGGLGAAVAMGRAATTGWELAEGFLVVSLTWLAAAALGALPFLLSGDAQLNRPVDAYFEGMSGFSTTGGSIVVDVEALPHGARDLAPVHPVAGRNRDHRARAGRAAAASRRRPSAARARDARPRDRDAEQPHPRHRAARVDPLHRADRGALRDPARARPERRRRRDVAVPGVRTRAHDDPDRGFSTKADSIEGFAPATQWVDRPLHDPGRHQLRADVPRRSCGGSHGSPREIRSCASTSPCSSSARP